MWSLMGQRVESEGLSLAYRIGWRVRYLGLHVFGPAQLGELDDPHERLKRERAARVAAARARRSSAGG